MTVPGFDAPPDQTLPDDGLRWLSEEEWDSPSCKVCLMAVRAFGPPPRKELRGEILRLKASWHSGSDYGLTLCGKDATPDGWWWPC